jgi:hypothetical protein
MDENQPFYRDPKKQILIAVVIVTIFYIYLMGRQGIALDVVARDDYAYVAMGASGGVRVVDVHDPSSPREVGFYDLPGNARGITLVDHYLLLADGERGMRILDVSNPEAPELISTFSTSGDTQDISTAGRFAYLAKGDEGISIVDISDPAHPVGVKNINLPGSAKALTALQVSTTLPPATDGQDSIEKQSTYLYVADGKRGLQVIDVTLSTTPVVMGGMDTPGEALDIAIDGMYVFIADSEAGLRVASIVNPIKPVEIGSIKTGGPAEKVNLNGAYILVAQGINGLGVVDAANLNGEAEAMNYHSTGNVMAAAGLGPYVLLAEGWQGLLIAKIGNSVEPEVVGVYDTPGEASLMQVGHAIWAGINGRPSEMSDKVWRTLRTLFIDLLLVLVGVLSWLGFFAQFSLPLQTLQDRIKAFGLMVGYYLGVRGPSLFIENGKLVERAREEFRSGPGVTILDTASAAVFRTRHAFTRPAGPGIIFTFPGEYPAGVIDLHQQMVSMGPPEKEDIKQDIFTPQRQDEDDDHYQDRQTRRYETSGLTRDGVEVAPNISISFQLDCTPGMGKTLFGYDPQSAWKAIAGVGIQPEAELGSDQRRVTWEWLPGHVAVDLWREYLRKYTLDELFAYSPSQNHGNSRRETAFDIISQMVKARLVSDEVEELDETGIPTGKKIHSREFQILKERGIKMHFVNIRNLRFPSEVENQLVDQWIATWLQRAQEEVRQSERFQTEERNRGQELAQKEYAVFSLQPLADALVNNPTLEAAPSLVLLLQGTLKLCIRELELNSRVTTQKSNLVELVEWIRKQ